MSTTTPKLPEVLEKAIDTVLAYRPKPKTKAAKKRKKAETLKRNTSRSTASLGDQPE
jgi:hypothetical protein